MSRCFPCEILAYITTLEALLGKPTSDIDDVNDDVNDDN
jgi:hypothetical protein